MLGHAGWSAGQLEREIENGDWLIQSTTADFIFHLPSDQMWEYAAKSIGLDISSNLGTSGQAWNSSCNCFPKKLILAMLTRILPSAAVICAALL